MLHIGNDIVDLTSRGNAGKSRDSRFVTRVFTNAEKSIISDSPDPDVMLWSLWAAKETAYKAAVKSWGGISSIPRAYEVDIHDVTGERLLSGQVKTPAGPVSVCLFMGRDYVHCLGGIFSGDVWDSVLWTVGEMDAESAEGSGYDSVFVRKLAGSYISRVVGADESAVEIISESGTSVPRLHVNGRHHGIDISLSHDGRFAAAAFLLNQAD